MLVLRSNLYKTQKIWYKLNMFNNLIKDNNKRMVEPFNLVGMRSKIFSKEEAVKILKDNSYYIFVAAILSFGFSVLIKLMDVNIDIPQEYLIGMGVFYLVLGFCIRKFKSRFASILALAIFGYIFIMRIFQNDIDGIFFFTFILLAASYRSVNASFFYHKVKRAKE